MVVFCTFFRSHDVVCPNKLMLSFIYCGLRGKTTQEFILDQNFWYNDVIFDQLYSVIIYSVSSNNAFTCDVILMENLYIVFWKLPPVFRHVTYSDNSCKRKTNTENVGLVQLPFCIDSAEVLLLLRFLFSWSSTSFITFQLGKVVLTLVCQAGDAVGFTVGPVITVLEISL